MKIREGNYINALNIKLNINKITAITNLTISILLLVSWLQQPS